MKLRCRLCGVEIHTSDAVTWKSPEEVKPGELVLEPGSLAWETMAHTWCVKWFETPDPDPREKTLN